MITIKRLSDCSLNDALLAWNLGFEDYFVKISFTLDQFIKRMAIEDLSPNYSIVAFDDDKPIGIIKSGIRDIKGEKVAYNGGTAVVKDYRKKGIGKRLMQYLLSIYEEEGVSLATLEAIKENKRAIELYKGIGYEVKDELANFALNGSKSVAIDDSLYINFTIEKTVLQKVSQIPFYKSDNPWQTHWKSVKNGEALIAYDKEGSEIGYAYFRRIFDANFQHTKTVLYQCEADPTHKEEKNIIKLLLTGTFEDFSHKIDRVVVNVPQKGSAATYNVLQELGFEINVKQVLMVK